MNRRLTAAAFFLLMTACASGQARLRVACVGDSITYGDQLTRRDTQSYPAVLERLSNGTFITGNFGVNGATALPVFFRDWQKTRAARDALAFDPDLVVVMLGINDLSFPELHDQYSASLQEIVTRFQNLPSHPRLFLCTLTPIAPPEEQAYANDVIRNTLNPAIRTVAARTGAHIIDISAVFPNRLELLPDGLHPSPEGAELIARTVLEALAGARTAPPAIQAAPGPVDVSLGHEARAARHRAEQWLASHPPPADLPDPCAAWTNRDLKAPVDIADLLPLLAGDAPPDTGSLFTDYARLACALDRIGHETVFLAEDRPVAWREALLHQLIQRQKIDASGGGFWTGSSPADAPRSTAAALQALTLALGR